MGCAFRSLCYSGLMSPPDSPSTLTRGEGGDGVDAEDVLEARKCLVDVIWL